MVQKKEKNNIVEFVSRADIQIPNRVSAVWKPGDPVGYIREEKDVPAYEFPVPGGKQYERLVPDTLDLATRARLGLNVLTEATDPKCDYAMYATVMSTNPTTMFHGMGDVMDPKYIESRPLLRLMTGDTTGLHVDKIVLKAYLRKIDDDGVVWEPIKGRPWMKLGVAVYGIDDSTLGDQLCFIMLPGRFLGAVTLLYLLTGDEAFKKIGERAVEGLKKMAVFRDDFAFYDLAGYGEHSKVNQDAPVARDTTNTAENPCRNIQGLAQFYRATGYEPAKEFAGKLIRHLRWHSGIFDGGRFNLKQEHNGHGGHFNCQSLGVLSMVEYGLAVQDRELLEFCCKCYESGRSIGEPLIGFFPEWTQEPESTHESCEAADMIGIAIKLSQAGIADYWDDADRYIRNHFAEGQLLEGDWIDDFAKKEYEPTDARPHETDKNVVRRNIGAFTGWASPNQWWDTERQKLGSKTSEGGIFIMHCCTGNATRAIYYAWEGILEFSKGNLKINLLLNRASEWADIDSYIPYEGRVDVHIKQTCNVMIRIPEWTKPDDIKCTVSGTARALSFEGRYAKLGSVNAGQDIVFSFPISQRTVDAKIANKNYRLTIKGNDVVDIDPAGKICPIYQRQHYRSNKAKKIKVERFVADKNIWW